MLRRSLSIAVAGALWAAAPLTRALPDVGKPVDPSKRADVSAAAVSKPSAMPLKPSTFANPRIIRPGPIDRRRAAVQDRRAAIAIEETRTKKTVRTERREFPVREGATVRLAGEMRASVPRLDEPRFRKMLQAYRAGLIPADSLLSPVQPAEQEATLAEINRFANPRSALEAQGIPVVPAGGGESGAATETPSADATQD